MMLKGALILAAGVFIGWAPQSFERALERHYLDRERAQAVALTLDNAELRHASRKLRQQCPARVHVQGLVFTPGEAI
jgi:hypothetical protein